MMLSLSLSTEHVLINYSSLPQQNMNFPVKSSLGDDALINSKPFKIKCFLFPSAPQSRSGIVPRSHISVNSGFWDNYTSSFVPPPPPSLPPCVSSACSRLYRPRLPASPVGAELVEQKFSHYGRVKESNCFGGGSHLRVQTARCTSPRYRPRWAPATSHSGERVSHHLYTATRAALLTSRRGRCLFWRQAHLHSQRQNALMCLFFQ